MFFPYFFRRYNFFSSIKIFFFFNLHFFFARADTVVSEIITSSNLVPASFIAFFLILAAAAVALAAVASASILAASFFARDGQDRPQVLLVSLRQPACGDLRLILRSLLLFVQTRDLGVVSNALTAAPSLGKFQIPDTGVLLAHAVLLTCT